MTLSAIARKYYGNTYCWVFIYEANKKTLKSPNYIPQGTRLVIPDLTDEQKHISKNKAEAIYEKLK
jgi:nucleoid-associated protein YgaU